MLTGSSSSRSSAPAASTSTSETRMDKGFATTLIHGGERRAAAVERYNEGKSSQFLYSRYENPTVVATEEKLAAADGAEAALAFSSGMAATTHALLTFLNAGDEVVCSSAIYGGTFHLLADFLPKFDIRPRFVSLEELREPMRVIGDRTRIVWFESPINPTL